MHHFPGLGIGSNGNKPEPLAVSLLEAQRLSGLSRITLYRANARGDLVFVKAGNKTLADYESLKNFMQGLPRFVGKTGLAA